MSFNGSGTFVLNVGGYPYVAGTTILSANVNALLQDLANGLSNTVTRDGQMTMTGPIHMGTQNLDATTTLNFSISNTIVATITTAGFTMASGALTATAFIPTGSTAPTNGMYLPSANTVGFATSSTLGMSLSGGTSPRILGDFSNATQASRLTIQSSTLNGNTIIQAAPNGTGTRVAFTAVSSSGISPSSAAQLYADTGLGSVGLNSTVIGGGTVLPLQILMNSAAVATWSTAGNLTLAAPSSGPALTVNGVNSSFGTSLVVQAAGGGAGATAITTIDTTTSATATMFASGTSVIFGSSSNHGIGLETNNTTRAQITAAGVFQYNLDAAGTYYELGTRIVPQNFQSGATYTLALTDSGKHVLMSGQTTATLTIPANASVAFPIGTVITIVNGNSGNLSVPITTDNLVLAGTATTGTRTLAPNAVATIVKTGSTGWYISGAGVS